MNSRHDHEAFEPTQLAAQNVTTDYWRAYFEWRSTFGLSDDCMKELLAAIRVEIAAQAAESGQLRHLKALERMIEAEQENDRQTSKVA